MTMPSKIERCRNELSTELLVTRETSPEKALVVAVLQRAIVDATTARVTVAGSADVSAPARCKEKAREWILARPDPSDTPFTFEWCCIQLDLCPRTIRRTIFRCIDEGRSIEWDHPVSYSGRRMVPGTNAA